jgi:hypothetical protein
VGQLLPIPPLLTAKVRVKRARQLVGTLKRQLQGWTDAHAEFIEAVPDAEGKIGLALTRPRAERLVRISVTVGETVYNLRSALDYVIHDLAWVATGKEVRGTQFPIEDDRNVFRSRITGKTRKGKPVAQYLKGVPPEAIPFIESWKPFAGCSWTKDLRDLSNPDKHRHLSPLRSDLVANVKDVEFVSLDPETGKGSGRIYYDAQVEVFLDDGRPVLETLQALCANVSATTDFFQLSIKSG